jgi:hypothetical protein
MVAAMPEPFLYGLLGCLVGALLALPWALWAGLRIWQAGQPQATRDTGADGERHFFL